MELTNSEVLALDAILEAAILQSGDDDDGDPVFQEVASDGVNPFADASALSEVYDSLSQKGLILCSALVEEGGDEVEFVCITPDGLEALKAAKGVH